MGQEGWGKKDWVGIIQNYNAIKNRDTRWGELNLTGSVFFKG